MKPQHLITLLFILLSIPVFTQSDDIAPPGQIYSVNGRNLHLNCQGQGSPTVIMVAGVGGFSMNWSWVQPQIANFTRVCSYDRPGYGWSEATVQPFAMSSAVDDLKNLLSIAGIEPPYIMVGHSFGGTITRAYQQAYPDDVVGMVWVDAVHPQMARRIPNYPTALRTQMDGLRIMSGFARLAAVNSSETTLPVPTNVPADIAETYILKLLEPNFFAASDAEARYLIDELPAVQLNNDLGELPLIVLAHGIAERRSFLGAPLSPSDAQIAETLWQSMQQELANLSENGELITSENSGHNIQFDQPELVTEAIREVYDRATLMLRP